MLSLYPPQWQVRRCKVLLGEQADGYTDGLRMIGALVQRRPSWKKQRATLAHRRAWRQASGSMVTGVESG